MINLLPPGMKQSYRYATRNVILLHWLVAGLFALVGLGLIGSYGWLAVRHSTSNSQQQANTLASALQKAQLNQTNQHVRDISNSLKLAQQVLSQEILFSKLLKQMATALPNGAKLTALNIPTVTSGSTLDVTAEATNYTTATQVQVNLADPDNQLFASADIESIACDASNAKDPDYPCQISLRAQFAQNNQFLFINQKQVKS